MKHSLKCPTCGEYRIIKYRYANFNDASNRKGFKVKIPFLICENCNKIDSVLPSKDFLEFLPSINDGEFPEISLESIFPELDAKKRYENFEYLEFQYDPRDYYIIPGLYRKWDIGYLTPVFFDKDLLLYYNGHQDYSVKFTSFSSCNIYYKGEKMFENGFGINRVGKLFMWLGDLDNIFNDESMKSHLKRFQSSNIPSDHEIVSKFYLRQILSSPSDAFQESDNELKLFELNNDFNIKIHQKFGLELTKVDIIKQLSEYKPPIMEEREQVFNTFLSLNKYLIENLKEQSLRDSLLRVGLKKEELQNKEGHQLKSLKLLTLFVKHVLEKENAETIISPLFVLNDLRQLHGHLTDTSFETKLNSCKQRLGLSNDATHLDIFKTLVKELIILYQSLIDK